MLQLSLLQKGEVYSVYRQTSSKRITVGDWRKVQVTCSRLSFSLLRMSSTSSRAFSRSCRSFCQYLRASTAADTFSSTSD